MLDMLKVAETGTDTTEDDSRSEFLASVHEGLAGEPKTLECKYFYDEYGSELFDQICDLPEYYPTRTEIGILQDKAGDIARILGADIEIIELGSGASIKTRILLGSLSAPSLYVPVDISEDFLLKVAEGLRKDFPGTEISPVIADFMQPFDLPGKKNKRLLFFPGSTIGNLHREQAARFLEDLKATTQADQFLIGVDLKKDTAVLEAAYDDEAGVTAAFNLNLLRRINRELGATFDLSKFAHRAIYNESEGRVEMHLVSLAGQTVRVCDRCFDFYEGETIHSENSYKYDVEEFAALAHDAGWQQKSLWTDAEERFAVFLLEAS